LFLSPGLYGREREIIFLVWYYSRVEQWKEKIMMTSTTTTTTTPPRRCRHHRLSFVCVNDVYSLDDLDSPSSSGGSSGSPLGGWCRAATLIKRIVSDRRRGVGGGGGGTVLAVVNGDVLGGSSLLVDTRGSVAIELMNSIPIDMACLGNHEFDHGDEELVDRICESDFDWLGSNVYYPPMPSMGGGEEMEGMEGMEEDPPRRR
jgi:2',3'-cyclic-nucleotide 2'-phosphodiesterase (5'-nucleotidase family)